MTIDLPLIKPGKITVARREFSVSLISREDDGRGLELVGRVR